MKFSDRESFQKHLKKKGKEGNYILVIPDAFERGELAQEIVNAKVGKSTVSFKLDMEKHSWERLHEELNSFSLFGEQRVLIVDNCHALLKNALESIGNYLKAPNSSLLLILLYGQVIKQKGIHKIYDEKGVLLEVPDSKPWEKEAAFEKWATHYLTKKNKKLAPQAFHSLFHHVGEDKRLLSQELDKLCTFTGDAELIQQADVMAVCVQLNLENSWKLGEAILQKNRTRALALVHTLLAEGTQPLALLAQLKHQLHSSWHALSLFDTTKSPEAVAKVYPYLKGRRFQKTLEQARSYSEPYFKRSLLAIHTLESTLKQEQEDILYVFDKLLLKLT